MAWVEWKFVAPQPMLAVVIERTASAAVCKSNGDGTMTCDYAAATANSPYPRCIGTLCQGRWDVPPGDTQ